VHEPVDILLANALPLRPCSPIFIDVVPPGSALVVAQCPLINSLIVRLSLFAID
jgi:hypothetical protein